MGGNGRLEEGRAWRGESRTKLRCCRRFVSHGPIAVHRHQSRIHPLPPGLPLPPPNLLPIHHSMFTVSTPGFTSTSRSTFTGVTGGERRWEVGGARRSRDAGRGGPNSTRLHILQDVRFPCYNPTPIHYSLSTVSTHGMILISKFTSTFRSTFAVVMGGDGRLEDCRA